MMGASDAQFATDRELLIRIDERTNNLTEALPKLESRVDALERDRDQMKAVVIVAKSGAGAGFIGMFTGIWHLLAHYFQGK